MIGETLGSYRLVSVVGQGGMGVVYRAQHELIGKWVAVKLLLPALTSDRDLVSRFFNEARAAAMTKHPGLVEVFDFGHHTNGAAYIVMELLEGEALAARISRESRLPPVTALAIARQVAGALHAAHEQGIVHRDLKPENVFLVADVDAPGGVRAKVLDFGIAKLARTEESRSVKTKTGAVFGTPRYMAPEQCKNATNVDRRADVYALGCILFEMVLGRAPFDYDSWGELVAAHIHETPPRPRELAPELPASIEAVILRALAKRTDGRYATMQLMAQDIESVWTTMATSPRAVWFTPPPMRAVQAAGDAPTMPSRSSEELAPTGRPVSGADPTVSAPASTARSVVAPTLPVNGEVSSARESTSPQGRMRWVGIAGAAVVIGGIASYPLWRSERPAAEDPAISAATLPLHDAGRPEAAPPTAPPDAASAAVEAREVTLLVESSPSGADVYRASDGVKLGRTPLTRVYARTDGVAELVVRFAGYRDARVALSTARDGKAHAQLVRAKATRVRDKQKPVGGTTVLDPYGDH